MVALAFKWRFFLEVGSPLGCQPQDVLRQALSRKNTWQGGESAWEEGQWWWQFCSRVRGRGLGFVGTEALNPEEPPGTGCVGCGA